MPSFERPVTAYLARLGAVDIAVEHGGKHPRVHFTHNGARMSYVFPGSSSSQDGPRNCLAALRRMVGVTPPPKSPRRRNGYRKPATKAVGALHLTAGRDPMAALIPLRTAMEAGAGAFLAGRGTEPPPSLDAVLGKAFRAGWWDAMKVMADG